MSHRVPKTALTLMSAVYRRILPEVTKELAFWSRKAKAIPNEELRIQAVSSIETKRFHCQGGAVFALLSGHRWREAVRFIVAYQTISDYLDNLCDRSTSLDPDDFRLLHRSMQDALDPDASPHHYYALRLDQHDGEYLADLVRTCQATLRQLERYSVIQPKLQFLEGLYEDLQVHKHVAVPERVPRLTDWHHHHEDIAKGLEWYEFSASAGSTLGIFCLVSYALRGTITSEQSDVITNSYFPYVQGLHILLDYYIDQTEDVEEGDLNFCSHYKDQAHLQERLGFFAEQSIAAVQAMPERLFHEMVSQGLVGLYFADEKVKTLPNGVDMTKLLLRKSGPRARFFHWNAQLIYWWSKRKFS
ncbi:tetraprenyl-beta-curcumene synthase family protein [Lentibacillus saliphilus]|uniref:tetraprenyl-beta-curcumene synthase family protein n=1 Tax=Lentibacillus saliphilus TaxID=2737028 RepID=UPI0031BAD237